MTADVELPPLPSPAHPTHAIGPLWSAEQMHAHAAHATAAKDAEIEALRAELREMRRAMAGEFKRAERLAEALQIAFRHLDIGSLRVSHKKDLAAIVAALHPTAAQENDDA